VKLIRGFVEDVFRSTVEFRFLFVLSGFGVVVRSDHLMVRWRFGARKLLVQVSIGNDMILGTCSHCGQHGRSEQKKPRCEQHGYSLHFSSFLLLHSSRSFRGGVPTANSMPSQY